MASSSSSVPVPAVEEVTSSAVVVPLQPNLSAIEALTTDFPETMKPEGLYAMYDDPKNNAWYMDLQGYVGTISDECLRHSAMHADTSRLNNQRHQVITILIILVPLFAGLIALLPFALATKNIVQGFLAFIGTVLGGLNKLMKFDAQSQEHRLSSDKYMNLNSSIVEQLLLPYERRYNGVLFERWCRKSFFTIKSISPYPDKKITKRIQKAMTPSRKEEPVVLVPPGEGGQGGSGEGGGEPVIVEPPPVPVEVGGEPVAPPTTGSYRDYLLQSKKRFMADTR
jgi:hypothetical protein